MSKEYKADASSSLPQIYTRKTCKDVHQLLLVLLHCYEESLTTLNTLQKSTIPPGLEAEHEVAIMTASTCATALRMLVYSSFFEEHIRRIQPPDPRTIQIPASPANAADDELGDEDDELMDTLPDAGIHGGPNPDEDVIVNLYLSFLRLQVGPFEAGDNLLGATSRIIGNRTITISTVATEHPPQTIRDWQDVVKEVMELPSDNASPCSAEQAIEVINGVFRAFGITGKLRCSGTTHCEAILALLIKSGKLPVSLAFYLLALF
jgi:hypothetical protein